MGITTNLVKCILFSEMMFFTLLILPVPKYCKKTFINFICTSRAFKPFLHILYVIYTMILIMFIDALVKIIKNINYEILYHTERNLYLTGFTIYISFIFRMFINTLNILYKEEESIKILKKQIKNSQSFVDSIVNSTSDKEEYIKGLNETIKDLNKKLESNEILIKQLKNNQGEYNALYEKYNNLLERIKKESKKSK